MSQTTVAQLRAEGVDARVLEGGYQAWEAAGLPMVAKAELDRFVHTRPSLWVTRRRPKIDRIACPWLIRRFLDAQARILFVDPDQVANVAKDSGGIPFDIKDVELSHEGERCSSTTQTSAVAIIRCRTRRAVAMVARSSVTGGFGSVLYQMPARG